MGDSKVPTLFSSARFAAAQPGGDPGELDRAAGHVGLAALRPLELGEAEIQDRIQVSDQLKSHSHNYQSTRIRVCRNSLEISSEITAESSEGKMYASKE